MTTISVGLSKRAQTEHGDLKVLFGAQIGGRSAW